MLWIAAGLIGVATVAPELDRVVQGSAAEADGGFAIPRAPDGQFYVEGRVGDAPLRFLIDEGSDSILISGADAERLALAAAPGGTVTLPRFAVGPHQVSNVTAKIAPDLPVSLLGRAFIARFGSAEVRRDRLVLR